MWHNPRPTPAASRRHNGQVLDAVASAPLFANLSLERIADLLDGFDEQHFRAGARIVLEGRTGSDFFLILDGEAAITFDGWPALPLGRGESFGEVGVLGDGTRLGGVQALSPLRCLVLPNGGLEDLILSEPVVGFNLLRTLVGRFRKLSPGAPAGQVASGNG